MSSRNNFGSTVLPVRKIQRKHFCDKGKFRKRSFGREQIKDTRFEQTSEYPWEIVGCSPLPLNLYFSSFISIFFNFFTTPHPFSPLQTKKEKISNWRDVQNKESKERIRSKVQLWVKVQRQSEPIWQRDFFYRIPPFRNLWILRFPVKKVFLYVLYRIIQ